MYVKVTFHNARTGKLEWQRVDYPGDELTAVLEAIRDWPNADFIEVCDDETRVRAYPHFAHRSKWHVVRDVWGDTPGISVPGWNVLDEMDYSFA